MNNFQILIEEMHIFASINEERSASQKEQMEREYKALKSIHKLTGKFIPFAKMGSLRYSVNKTKKVFHLMHPGLNIDAFVNFNDVDHYSGLGVYEFADFLNRNGANEVDENGNIVHDNNKFAQSSPNITQKNNSTTKMWKQVGDMGFWKLVDV